MTGWTGANQVSAPLAPSSATTSLLQIGQPIANTVSTVPPAVRAVGGRAAAASRPARRYVATVIPTSTAVAIQNG